MLSCAVVSPVRSSASPDCSGAVRADSVWVVTVLMTSRKAGHTGLSSVPAWAPAAGKHPRAGTASPMWSHSSNMVVHMILFSLPPLRFAAIPHTGFLGPAGEGHRTSAVPWSPRVPRNAPERVPEEDASFGGERGGGAARRLPPQVPPHASYQAGGIRWWGIPCKRGTEWEAAKGR